MFHQKNQKPKHYNTLIIGAGPSGLITSFFLGLEGIEHLVIERSNQVGSSWLNLPDDFILAMMVSELEMRGLDLSQFKPEHHLTRDEMIKLLKDYAKKYNLPIHFNTTITSITQDQDSSIFYVDTSTQNRYSANNIIVCIGPRHELNYPDYIKKINPELFIHSANFKNITQFNKDKKNLRILIVGGGLSALSIAHNIKKSTSSHKVFLACNNNDFEVIWRNLHLFSGSTQQDKNVIPLVNSFLPSHLKKQGITNYGRLIDVTNEGYLHFRDENNRDKFISLTEFDQIILATGFRSYFPFFKELPRMPTNQLPDHKNGITSIHGLYIVGTPSSDSLDPSQTVTINKGSQDAEEVVREIARQRLFSRLFKAKL